MRNQRRRHQYDNNMIITTNYIIITTNYIIITTNDRERHLHPCKVRGRRVKNTRCDR
jgi:hypothetical protein